MSIPVILVLIAAGFILKSVIRKDGIFNFIGILANDILLSFFVLASIAGKYDLVQAYYDGAWHSYPGGDLTTVNEKMGCGSMSPRIAPW